MAKFTPCVKAQKQRKYVHAFEQGINYTEGKLRLFHRLHLLFQKCFQIEDMCLFLELNRLIFLEKYIFRENM